MNEATQQAHLMQAEAMARYQSQLQAAGIGIEKPSQEEGKEENSGEK